MTKADSKEALWRIAGWKHETLVDDLDIRMKHYALKVPEGLLRVGAVYDDDRSMHNCELSLETRPRAYLASISIDYSANHRDKPRLKRRVAWSGDIKKLSNYCDLIYALPNKFIEEFEPFLDNLERLEQARHFQSQIKEISDVLLQLQEEKKT